MKKCDSHSRSKFRIFTFNFVVCQIPSTKTDYGIGFGIPMPANIYAVVISIDGFHQSFEIRVCCEYYDSCTTDLTPITFDDLIDDVYEISHRIFIRKKGHPAKGGPYL